MKAYINIAGRKIALEWESGDNYGTYYHDEKKITLDPVIRDNPEALLETLFHEMTHAALKISGVAFGLADGQEEQIVRCLEQLLLPAWNKVQADALKWAIKSIKDEQTTNKGKNTRKR
jgi:hypothetical protein